MRCCIRKLQSSRLGQGLLSVLIWWHSCWGRRTGGDAFVLHSVTYLGYNGLCTFVLPICLFHFWCFRCFSPRWIAGLLCWRLLTLPSAVCLLPFISSSLSVEKKSLQTCLNKVKTKFLHKHCRSPGVFLSRQLKPTSQNLFLLSWSFLLTSCFLFLFWEMHLEKLLNNTVALPNKASFTPVTELISRHKPMNSNILITDFFRNSNLHKGMLITSLCVTPFIYLRSCAGMDFENSHPLIWSASSFPCKSRARRWGNEAAQEGCSIVLCGLPVWPNFQSWGQRNKASGERRLSLCFSYLRDFNDLPDAIFPLVLCIYTQIFLRVGDTTLIPEKQTNSKHPTLPGASGFECVC